MSITLNPNFYKRPLAVLSVFALLAAVVAPILDASSASAGQVTTRFIQMSDSTPSGTGATYNISFKPTTTSTIGGIVVDFCADSPLIGSTTCTYPANFSVGGATPTASAITGFSTSTGSWVTTNSLQGGAAVGSRQVFKYTNATAQTPTGTSTAINFTITNVVNPSTTGTFYARIVTFDTDTNATSNYTGSGTTRAATFAGQRDYGGVALSTANVVSITAAVMETLRFCVSKLAPGPGCGTSGQAVTTPTLTLGHGSPLALDSSAIDTDTAYTQLSTNANGGAVVNLNVTSSSTCSGLSRDGGATCGIPAKGAFGTMTAGTAAFGLLVANGTGGSGAAVTADSDYGTTAANYGMGVAAPFSTYGDPIESTTGATADKNSLLTYAATAATTTPAGIYTATHALVVTGTF